VRISKEDYQTSDKKYHTFKKITLKDKDNNYFFVDVDDERRINNELVPIAKNMVPIKSDDNSFTLIHKEEYDINKHKTSNFGKTAVVDIYGKSFLIDSNDERYLNGELQSVHKGKILCKNKEGKTFLINKEKFNSGDYVGVNKGNIDTEKNPNAKKISIYNQNDEKIYECLGNFKTICLENNLPTASLARSYRKNGQRIYNSTRGFKEAEKLNNTKFIGWYAKIEY
jgi:hypothetical protein